MQLENHGRILVLSLFSDILRNVFAFIFWEPMHNFLPSHCFSDGFNAQSWCFTSLENFVRFGGFSDDVFSLFGLLRGFFINFFFFFEFGQNDWRERVNKDRLSRRFVSGRAWRFWRCRRVVKCVTRDVVWWRSLKHKLLSEGGLEYSGGLKSGNIWIQDFWRLDFNWSGFQVVQFSNGWALGMA